MEFKEFNDKYNALIGEMSEYWDGAQATGKESDDIKLAELWLEERDGNPLSVNIASLRAMIVEGREVLARFDECAPYVIKELNLGRTNTPAKARAWLEKMIPIWEDVLKKVEAKWRSQGSGGTCRG